MKRALKSLVGHYWDFSYCSRFIFQSEYTGWYLVRFRLIQCLPPWLVEITYLFLCKFPDVEYTKKDPLRPEHYLIHRRKGAHGVKKGDVVVFNFPYAKTE